MRYARLLGAVRPLVLLVAAALAVAACSDGSDGGTSAGGGAEGYPDQNITMVVPFSAGGPTDTVTRMIAEPMSAKLGAQIVVQNVEGAGGTVAAGEVVAGPAGRLHRAHASHRHVDGAGPLRRPAATSRLRTSRRSAW